MVIHDVIGREGRGGGGGGGRNAIPLHSKSPRAPMATDCKCHCASAGRRVPGCAPPPPPGDTVGTGLSRHGWHWGGRAVTPTNGMAGTGLSPRDGCTVSYRAAAPRVARRGQGCHPSRELAVGSKQVGRSSSHHGTWSSWVPPPPARTPRCGGGCCCPPRPLPGPCA